MISLTGKEYRALVTPIMDLYYDDKKPAAARIIKSYGRDQVAMLLMRGHFGYSADKYLDFFVLDVLAGHWDIKIERYENQIQEAIKAAVRRV